MHFHVIQIFMEFHVIETDCVSLKFTEFKFFKSIPKAFCRDILMYTS